jgi:hypothetical protein
MKLNRKNIKPVLMLFSTVFFVAIVFISCEVINEMQSTSKLTFKASVSIKTNLNDTVIFSGKDIKWFNSTTGELTFADSLTPKKLNLYHWLKCYLGTDSLFTITLTSDIMSNIINDIVLNHNLRDGKYYFEDGYPAWIDNLGTNSIRIQNKEKRSAAWNRFIAELKLEGKLKE